MSSDAEFFEPGDILEMAGHSGNRLLRSPGWRALKAVDLYLGDGTENCSW